MRGTQVSSRTTWAAAAKAASAAPASPASESTHTLPPSRSQSTGVPAAVASRVAVTDGSGSQSTWTRRAASAARAAVSATTIATASPAKRARSTGSGG
jgi:hypothetical protein